ncbi:NADP-dependent oxidoreductase [Virgibacillus profundi]|uniref:NADP-dependent oxidoreductase n=1 Tax=Virgibacillus profundi TaxID=2024555 RepID=A0A2A2I9U8_9BACI|nr:NADP-dependent oxidoreductase [Virgibacillus profundi]PAV28054.1 NADP-dependent oxidoreductase [Virgibacillus profundi]PXY52358.1 NADP-dependent oxidoreductase [Virgibacillus profundi]
MKSQQLLLKMRPNGLPDEQTFEFRHVEAENLEQGELLLKTLYISVDPYMRGRMSNQDSYVEPFQIGEPLAGGIVAQVMESRVDDFKSGDIVRGNLPFQEYNTVKADNVSKVNTHGLSPSTALGVLGMPGLTAYFGMMHIGEPKKGETVVVSAAAGAVGQIAGQLAKQTGARVVGIVGSKEKADYITEKLGFDAAVEYKAGNLEAQLQKTCPNGIDVYYENVGGEIGDAIWPHLNNFARVPVCGAISSYNLKEEEVDLGPRVQQFLIKSRVKMQGFLVGDFAKDYKEAYKVLAEGVSAGKLIFEETIHEGFETIPKAFNGLFTGENIGKQLVKITEAE